MTLQKFALGVCVITRCPIFVHKIVEFFTFLAEPIERTYEMSMRYCLSIFDGI